MLISRPLTLGLALALLGGLVAWSGVQRLRAQESSDPQDKPAIARPAPDDAPAGSAATTKPESDTGPGPNQDSQTDGAATDAEEADSNHLAALFPIGRVFEGVKIPSYSGDTLSSVVHADFMRRADDEHLEMEMLEIVIYTAGEPDSRILTDRAIYDMDSGTLRSTTPARIMQKQFEMRGDRMLFDSETRIGHLSGNVKTRIHQAADLMKSGGGGK